MLLSTLRVQGQSFKRLSENISVITAVATSFPNVKTKHRKYKSNYNIYMYWQENSHAAAQQYQDNDSSAMLTSLCNPAAKLVAIPGHLSNTSLLRLVQKIRKDYMQKAWVAKSHFVC